MTNYIKVDEEREYRIITVYDCDEEILTREFDDEDPCQRRCDAEAYAEAEAKRLGCEWGTNYP